MAGTFQLVDDVLSLLNGLFQFHYSMLLLFEFVVAELQLLFVTIAAFTSVRITFGCLHVAVDFGFGEAKLGIQLLLEVPLLCLDELQTLKGRTQLFLHDCLLVLQIEAHDVQLLLLLSKLYLKLVVDLLLVLL